MLLGTFILTYILGILYGFIPFFSYFIIVMSSILVFMFSYDYLSEITWGLFICITFALLIGLFTYFGNSFIANFTYPYKLLIHEMTSNFKYKSTSDAYPLRSLINAIRYSKLKKRILMENGSIDFKAFKKEIKIIGFNSAVESYYFKYSRRDNAERYKIKAASKSFNTKLKESINKYGKYHPEFISSWRPNKNEFIWRNEILNKENFKELYPETKDYYFKVYRGSHAYIGIIQTPVLSKPKVLLGEDLLEVTRATVTQYKELIERH